MVEQNGIRSAAIVVRDFRRLERDGAEEGFLVGKTKEFKALLDGAADASAVGADVTKELCKFAGFKNELAQSFMTY